MDVVVRNWPDGKKPTRKDATLMLEEVGVLVVPHLHVEVQDDDWDHYVTARLIFSMTEARYFAQEVSVGVSPRANVETDDDDNVKLRENRHKEVTSVLLRQARVGEIVRLGASGGIFTSFNRDEPPMSLQDFYGPKGEPRYTEGNMGDFFRSVGPVDSTLGMVGISYMIARMSGEPPAKAVERQFGIPPRTAAHWISRAKATGKILTPNVKLR